MYDMMHDLASYWKLDQAIISDDDKDAAYHMINKQKDKGYWRGGSADSQTLDTGRVMWLLSWR